MAVAPAGAGVHAAAASQAAFCDPISPADARVFGGSVTGGNAILGRGGVVREPDLAQTHADMPASAKGKAGRSFKATVPVYFHVVTDGAIGALTDAQIAAQIAVLNNTFSARRGRRGDRLQLQARRRHADRQRRLVLREPGRHRRALDEAGPATGRRQRAQPYSTTAGDYLGWAYLPDITTKPGQAYLDGVVFDWESMPGTSATYAGRYDQGETGTHEVGHWLNLEHTFYGGCSAKGDFVDDTPAEKTRDLGLPGRQGHLHGAGPGPDPQLHGLLLRLLLHGVHRGPGAAHARRLAAVPRELGPDASRGARPARAPRAHGPRGPCL